MRTLPAIFAIAALVASCEKDPPKDPPADNWEPYSSRYFKLIEAPNGSGGDMVEVCTESAEKGFYLCNKIPLPSIGNLIIDPGNGKSFVRTADMLATCEAAHMECTRALWDLLDARDKGCKR